RALSALAALPFIGPSIAKATPIAKAPSFRGVPLKVNPTLGPETELYGWIVRERDKLGGLLSDYISMWPWSQPPADLIAEAKMRQQRGASIEFLYRKPLAEQLQAAVDFVDSAPLSAICGVKHGNHFDQCVIYANHHDCVVGISVPR